MADAAEKSHNTRSKKYVLGLTMWKLVTLTRDEVVGTKAWLSGMKRGGRGGSDDREHCSFKEPAVGWTVFL